jgi:hypothetical protein
MGVRTGTSASSSLILSKTIVNQKVTLSGAPWNGHAGRGHHVSRNAYRCCERLPSRFLVRSLSGIRKPVAARARQGHRLALRAVDLAERPTTNTSAPDDHQSVVAPLTARIETLEAEFAKLEATAAVHRADFERERERCGRLMAEALKTTADLIAAREAAARIAGELAAFRALPWWRRLSLPPSALAS